MFGQTAGIHFRTMLKCQSHQNTDKKILSRIYSKYDFMIIVKRACFVYAMALEMIINSITFASFAYSHMLEIN